MSESAKSAEAQAETQAETQQQPVTLLDLLEEQLQAIRVQTQAIAEATTSALTMLAVAKAQQHAAAHAAQQHAAQQRQAAAAKESERSPRSTFGRHRSSAEGSTL